MGQMAHQNTQPQRPAEAHRAISKVASKDKIRLPTSSSTRRSFKVIIEDESAEEYYRKLSNITARIQKIGILYNHAVRAINSYHPVKAAQIMLQRLEQFSQQIITLEQLAIELTWEYQKR